MTKKYVRQDKSQPKHTHYSSAQPILRNSQVPSRPSSRPEWRGSGFQKPKKPAHSESAPKTASEKALFLPDSLPLELQQRLLDVVRHTFPICTEDPAVLKHAMTAVKSALDAGGLNSTSFEETGPRQLFMTRWGLERGIAVGTLLADWAERAFKNEPVFETLRTGHGPFNAVVYGCGVSELVSFSALYVHLQNNAISARSADSFGTDGHGCARSQMTLHIASGLIDWSKERSGLLSALYSRPPLSEYASTAARAEARSFLPPNSLGILLTTQDRIEMPTMSEYLKTNIGDEPYLITLCFVVKELQAVSLAKTVKTLMTAGDAAPTKSLILVVDDLEGDTDNSPEVEKMYPLRFLLDLALLGKGTSDEGNPSWERLVGDEERTFKIDKSLNYPLSLGAVRMQIHLFRKN